MRLVPFTTLTRTRTLPTATGEADALGDVAVALLDRVDGLARGVRLLGVRLEMTPPEERAGLPPRA